MVDLPAPFSPTTPWMVPRATPKLTEELATTEPKDLVIDRNSNAFSVPNPSPYKLSGIRNRLGDVVVRHLNPAGDDFVAQSFDAF